MKPFREFIGESVQPLEPGDKAFRVVDGFVAYHVTFAYHRDSIMKSGLRLDQPSNENTGEVHGAVFFADNEQAMVLADHTEDAGEEPLILQIYIPRGKVVFKDEAMPADTSFYIREPILARRIREVERTEAVNWDFRKNLKPLKQG